MSISVRDLPASERRKLVVLGVAANMSNRRIAKALQMSEGTVRRDIKILTGALPHGTPKVRAQILSSEPVPSVPGPPAPVVPKPLSLQVPPLVAAPSNPVQAKSKPTPAHAARQLSRRLLTAKSLPPRPDKLPRISDRTPEKPKVDALLEVLQSSKLGQELSRLNNGQTDAVGSTVPKHLRYGRKLIDGLSTEGKGLTQLLDLTKPDIRRRQGPSLPDTNLPDTKFLAHWLARWIAATIPNDAPRQTTFLRTLQQWIRLPR